LTRTKLLKELREHRVLMVPLEFQVRRGIKETRVIKDSPESKASGESREQMETLGQRVLRVSLVKLALLALRAIPVPPDRPDLLARKVLLGKMLRQLQQPPNRLAVVPPPPRPNQDRSEY
jgi:hypothetical protein